VADRAEGVSKSNKKNLQMAIRKTFGDTEIIIIFVALKIHQLYKTV